MRVSWVPVYVGILYVGAITVPGVGIFGQAISRLPGGLLEWSHAPMYGLLSWMLTRSLQGRGWPRIYALIVSMAAALVFGIWTEVAQASIPGRTTSFDDLLLDGFGIAATAILMLWFGDSHTRRSSYYHSRILEPGNSYQQG